MSADLEVGFLLGAGLLLSCQVLNLFGNNCNQSQTRRTEPALSEVEESARPAFPRHYQGYVYTSARSVLNSEYGYHGDESPASGHQRAIEGLCFPFAGRGSIDRARLIQPALGGGPCPISPSLHTGGGRQWTVLHSRPEKPQRHPGQRGACGAATDTARRPDIYRRFGADLPDRRRGEP